ncbi:MAG: ribonuclease D, partial [Bacteroidota bacterium]
MTNDKYPYQLLETPQDVVRFGEQNKHINWMALDTEFIGEKRYYTLLCLVQVTTEHGNYVFDILRCDEIQPLLDLIVREDIVKITHAGENDYRLFHTRYGILPKNLFDTQIAAGFVGYKYPVSFRTLLEEELSIRLNKSQTVTDWEQRPIKPKQLKYAIEDVIFLEELREKMLHKLEARGRANWALQECAKMETAAFYERDPNKEALKHSLMPNLN